jgi:hypothetical protein
MAKEIDAAADPGRARRAPLDLHAVEAHLAGWAFAPGSSAADAQQFAWSLLRALRAHRAALEAVIVWAGHAPSITRKIGPLPELLERGAAVLASVRDDGEPTQEGPTT